MPQQGALALVGGGRWAAVYLSVLAAMPLSAPLVVVTRHGTQRFAGMRDHLGRPVTVLPHLEALLESTLPAGAIVVNAAAAHAATALRLLRARVPVLVEKPGATDFASAKALVEAAREEGLALMPALTYLHCAYLDNFAAALRRCAARPSVLRMYWADPVVETRYGEQKLYDRSIGVTMDVMPHIWAILATVLGRSDLRVQGCRIERGGLLVAVWLHAGDVACEIVLEREAAQRRRLLEIDGRASIDFAVEPGIITIDEARTSGDHAWSTRADRPVRRQIEAFLGALGDTRSGRALDDFQASSRLAVECDGMVKQQQARLLAGASVGSFGADVACAVRELLAQRLLGSGSLQPGDLGALESSVAALRAQVMLEPAGNWLDALARGVAS